MKQTKALEAALICLLILAIFSYATATLGPSIQVYNVVSERKTALHNSPNVLSKETKGPIKIRGDPIEDPIPHTK